MNEHGSPGSGIAGQEPSSEAVSLNSGHVVGDGGIPERFTNPGLPPHQPRHADLDPKAAKRAERQVLFFFTLSILGTIGFVIAYFAIDRSTLFFMPFFGYVSLLHTVIGVCMGLSLLGIGLAAVHWAKTLMPEEEVVEQRHVLRSSDEDRIGFAETLSEGAKGAQLGRRPMIGILGGTALGIFAVPPALQLVGGLGPLPEADLSETFWQTGMRLMRDPEMTPIKASDVTIGSAFHVLPEHMEASLAELDKLGYVSAEEKRTGKYRFDQDLEYLERKAKAPVLLMRLNPDDIESQKERDWGYQGIVAYNKICTHAGCPVGLYEQQTHHLLCPCHQSTFDLKQDCKVVFGPAHRALPQLPITVDKEGYLVAAAGFKEPVGPSFWERG
ncbi:ubiquinol-cytochrome c reductase iron-sulfur subunit [Dermatophilus congolensis]|uniref:Cytochrome bc1 complex Rieske iron-sulfur subunit n=1 Tax=Dermatophilus congolensis TaxID=1863 RepID=A0A239VQ04_9MICO|nr:Rieske 2Fe-2S domain-containing protein [Dermatophilus congolensis]MBO3129618.1 Rieske (2Fe-2S) protein [Dermatophilus congolensis]MBO3131749.1 Rieske (2Fe-2S) protein [Dermatophilus congolensis]MBO3134094.1 Rieske (2Fe-2S) protein [Dermatophilus congolensis]MBO3136326.1 Rieske (2Fe-2S) protein [Dermatophilus congolensis]MBO3138574.1 Rieske (2Fe-2S) protein [Dermatophilus congolensis]